MTGGSSLIVIQEDLLKVYPLDEKKVWKVGRRTRTGDPDINLFSPCVSREHGQFIKVGDAWFYRDLFGKNGTTYNGRAIRKKRTVVPKMLAKGDQFVFGSGGTGRVEERTAWAMFWEGELSEDWKRIRAGGRTCFSFRDPKGGTVTLRGPGQGLCYESSAGLVICMGNFVFINGEIEAADSD